jgi:hypothetical protein
VAPGDRAVAPANRAVVSADRAARRPTVTVADRPPDRSPGWLRAMVVGGLAVDAVLVTAALTFLLPPAVGDVVFRTPLLILVLIGGTAAVLWTITRPRRLDS